DRSSFDTPDPLPLAVLGPDSLSVRIAATALEQAGRTSEIVYAGKSLVGVFAAVRAGLAITAVNEGAVPPGLALCTSSSDLPALPPLFMAVYRREGALAAELADLIAAAIEPRRSVQQPAALALGL